MDFKVKGSTRARRWAEREKVRTACADITELAKERASQLIDLIMEAKDEGRHGTANRLHDAAMLYREAKHEARDGNCAKARLAIKAAEEIHADAVDSWAMSELARKQGRGR